MIYKVFITPLVSCWYNMKGYISPNRLITTCYSIPTYYTQRSVFHNKGVNPGLLFITHVAWRFQNGTRMVTDGGILSEYTNFNIL